MTAMPTAIPDGYMKDAKGRLVPLDIISPIDKARDEFVQEALKKALVTQEQIRALKLELYSDIAAFVELSAERYGVDIGGQKGNIQLSSFDGSVRVLRAIADTLTFDEGLQAAKALIDECVQEWVADARPEIKALIADAFQTDKGGNISTSRVLGLQRLDIKDEKWLRAMQAIRESLRVACSKSYIRIEQRINGTSKFASVCLDFASV